MLTSKHATRSADYVSQSRVVRSDSSSAPRWSAHAMRTRSRYGGAERRGWQAFVYVGRLRLQVGTR